MQHLLQAALRILDLGIPVEEVQLKGSPASLKRLAEVDLGKESEPKWRKYSQKGTPSMEEKPKPGKPKTVKQEAPTPKTTGSQKTKVIKAAEKETSLRQSTRVRNMVSPLPPKRGLSIR
ncbi:hypothetical protein DL95DRAFT_471040 [Leptodontidium sp. 2 PMI_412]|nr:hypothetical protein DL95DRAFT_471040 [Leptodontidium sp. 2 PMI_412]